jgi:S-disulfanyl-L-cysteine oxidoreductase SoxD
MSRFRNWAPACSGAAILAIFAGMTLAFAGPYPGIGRTATPDEIKAWDIDVRPDFKGLPPGSGSVAQGQKIWDGKCAACHGTFGESNEIFTPLVGGTTADDIRTGRVKSLVTGDVARTTLMKLSTISTLWDYIRRAMPWNAPKSLSPDEVYAVVAYMLNLGDVLPDDFVLSDKNIAEVQQRLPNRNGMTRNHGLGDVHGKPDVANVACMRNCAIEVGLASTLPEGAQGNLADQQRVMGPARGNDAATSIHADATKPSPANVADLARRKACLACHAVDKKIVGPAFRDVAQRYKGAAEVEARLVEKMRKGGAGAWGPLPMPPNPDLAESDARALIQWILAGAV